MAELASFIVMARNGVRVHPMPGYRMQVVEGEHPASSTRIREALARKDGEIPHLDPEVARLIRTQRGIL
jgi:nicotinic acid mononucleotide adenylyltransferase